MDYKGDRYYIERVLNGEVAVFSYIVDRYKDHAFNLAFRICGNREEAEEASQDSFLKVFRSLKGFRMKSSFSTWLYRIVYNTSVSYIRSKKKGVLSLEDFPADAMDFAGIYSTEAEAEDEYRNSLVNFALQKLDDEERGIISLYYYEEMSTEEIAEVTGISRSNIKVRLFRTRQKLLGIIKKIEKEKVICHE
jgi:RNA polymerase sigma-70 factor (ECF subfamily)